MDLKDLIAQLETKVEKMLPQIQTEEATKNALIMPFIQILGYDVFNPSEVNPEFIADIGIKKGEKVDYAIMKDGEPIILIECKHHLEKLDPHNSQLFRYFHTSSAKFGILSNGLLYRFYTDLIEPNKMDEKPFYEFDISNIKDNDIIELKKFHKSYFDKEIIFNSASELKYSNEIKSIIINELKAPSESFVKFFTAQVYHSKSTARIISQFTDIVQRSFSQLINDMINERLKSALTKEDELTKKDLLAIEDKSVILNEENSIVTTEEEKEGFHIVKAILRKKIEGSRITIRDTKTYFGILLDDNNRKPICRLWLNGSKKYISIFDLERKEVKHELLTLEDIYNFSEQLFITLETYNNAKE